MGDSQVESIIQDVLEERGGQYGEAWKESGIWMSNIAYEDENAFQALLNTPYFYNWTIVFNKMFRLLHNPNHVDSWLDIAGYAQLVVDDLKKKEQNETQTNVPGE